MRIVALLLVACACGDNLPDPRTVRSGSRLKLGWYVYDDDTRQREMSWYYDSLLDVRCSPRVWSDGNRYCAPATGEAVYVSDTCTQAVGQTLAGSEPATWYATSFYLAGQKLQSRVFRRGAPAAVPFTIYEKHEDGCVGPLQPPTGYEYYELGDELTNLVRLQRSAPRGTGELAVVDETSEDGLRVPIAYYDRALEVECTPAQRANVESVECVPNDMKLASHFHEVGCQEPELVVTDGSTPITAKVYSPVTRCWRYYDVGSSVAAPPLYEGRGDMTCTAASPPPGAAFYLMAGPHQTQGLVREREETMGRLARIELTRDDLRIEDPMLFDTDLEVECRRDEQRRCVPATEAVIEPFFADPGCTTPLDLALVPAGQCDPWSMYARKGDAYYPMGEQYTRQIYWLSTGDTCGMYRPPTSFVAYTVGPAIDPATFARAKLVIDP